MTANLFQTIESFWREVSDLNIKCITIINVNKCPFKNIAVIIQSSQIITISRSYSSFIYLPSLNVNIFVKPNGRKQFWISEQCFLRYVCHFACYRADRWDLTCHSKLQQEATWNTHKKNVGCQWCYESISW